MSRAKEQERLHALRDREDTMAREASLARKSIDKTIIKKGVRAHVKVDP